MFEESRTFTMNISTQFKNAGRTQYESPNVTSMKTIK